MNQEEKIAIITALLLSLAVVSVIILMNLYHPSPINYGFTWTTNGTSDYGILNNTQSVSSFGP